MPVYRKQNKHMTVSIPSSLLELVKLHHPRAHRWEALARAGQKGYKHVGLVIEVTDDDGTKPPTHAEVARAIVSMLHEDQEKREGDAPVGYRIDALDEDDARLNDPGLYLPFSDGEASDDETTQGRWALKALDALHKRHLDLLDRIGVMTGPIEAAGQMAQDSLEALARLVADVIEIKLDAADKRMESEDEERKHERKMKLLDFIIAQSAGAGSNSPTPLLELLKRIDGTPDGDAVADALGADNLSAVRNAAANPDRAARAEALVQLLTRFRSEPEVAAKLNALPEKLRNDFQAAIMAEIKAGQT